MKVTHICQLSLCQKKTYLRVYFSKDQKGTKMDDGFFYKNEIFFDHFEPLDLLNKTINEINEQIELKEKNKEFEMVQMDISPFFTLSLASFFLKIGAITDIIKERSIKNNRSIWKFFEVFFCEIV